MSVTRNVSSITILIPTLQSVVKALTHIIQLPTAGIHRLQQLVHLIITHLLTQVREDIPELSHADEAREILVEYLETAAVFFGLAGIAEAAGAVEDLLEGVKVDCVRLRISIPSRRVESSSMSKVCLIAGGPRRRRVDRSVMWV